EHRSFLLDCALVLLTVVTLISREKALLGVNRLLKWLDAPADVIRVSKREDMLVPFPPPGADTVVVSR
ncbi:MAG: sugar transferase, partial [Thermodesulfobacteriota bacterium]|nr:sugar transferase [Thermodesulfobacteriota bacterium]